MTNTSLIIPCQEDHSEDINNLFKSIISWTVHPSEILVVDSSKNQIKVQEKFIHYCNENKLVFKHLFFKNEFFNPGHARNIGLSKASYENIAFLDVKTIPSNLWLEKSIRLIAETNSLIVWGKTFYEANNKKEQIIRAATYGMSPIRTLPGSLINHGVFVKCGNFIQTVRAGEDADWIKRCSLHQIDFTDSNELCNYSGLSGISYLEVLKKWFRNYRSASFLPYISPHKDLYFYSISLFLIVIAYNWNWFWLDWRLNDEFYLPNITKISILIISLFYIFLRGVFLPITKGVKWHFLFPFNFLIISILSALIDFTKAMAFVISKINR